MYLIFKLIHVSAVILFLGNIITGLFWKAHADRTRDPRMMANTLQGIIRSDRWFTIPGVIVITLGGFAAAIHGSIPILGTGWILWSIVLFSLSGFAFSFSRRATASQACSTGSGGCRGWAARLGAVPCPLEGLGSVGLVRHAYPRGGCGADGAKACVTGVLGLIPSQASAGS